MATGGLSLSQALPAPKYTGENEEQPAHTKQRGPRVVGAGVIDDTRVALKRSGPPPYGNRTGWRPRAPEDYGDGGAFPEVLHAQYPLDMGRKQESQSNALAIQVDGEGKIKYDAIARRGHSNSRIIHSQFKDLIPLRQQANAGELSLERPSEEEVAEAKDKTQKALDILINGAVASQKPKNVKGTSRAAPTYVSYTPDNQMGDKNGGKTRIIKIVERQQDPMEPPKHKAKKIPRGPPSPPPPVMRSPPRKLTAEDQEAWKIPPPVSNWKNPKGYTVPLDKRLAADGRGIQEADVNDKFAQLSEALSAADSHAREEVKQRALMQQRLAEKEKAQKEEHLRQLAQRAREDRAAQGARRRRSHSYSRSRSRSGSPYSDRSGESDGEGVRERERLRREKREEHERKLRQSRMGAEKRVQAMAREQNRDISEKVALGLAKPTASGESMYDSRLFNQTSAFSTGFNEDQAYDKPLFADRDKLRSIYRPMATNDEQGEDDGETMDKIQGTNRFDVLNKPSHGFQGTEKTEAREGPVQFEKDDPYNINGLLAEARATSNNAEASGSKKRYGMQENEGSKKRARVDADDEDDADRR